MEISIAEQTWVFLRAAVLGAACAVLYDVFRVIRRFTRARALKTAFFDALYFVLLMAAVFLFTLYSGGQVRFYIFLGLLLGALLYFFSASSYFVKGSLCCARSAERGMRKAGRRLKKQTCKLEKRVKALKIHVKGHEFLKKLFKFLFGWLTIRSNSREASGE